MGPYLRVYFSDYNVSPFFHTNLGYSRLKLMPNSDSEDVELKMNGFNYGIGLGLEIFNTGKYSLE
ncbi:MAG: hypothetical protein MI922_30010, partial [Bacteroidales bacterium]|nr:hypothetical protein [Bacteroidales bacterium]